MGGGGTSPRTGPGLRAEKQPEHRLPRRRYLFAFGSRRSVGKYEEEGLFAFGRHVEERCSAQGDLRQSRCETDSAEPD